MAELFGFEIKRKSESDSNAKEVSFAAPQQDDGALQVSATGGAYGTYVDLEGTAKNEAELVTRYRKMGMQPECEHAIDDIVNETIVSDPTEKVVDINLDNVKITANVKKAIMAEFENITSLLNINKLGYEIFRKWYVDGRLYFHAIIDENAPEHGIKELRYVDPRKIRKVREVKKQRDRNNVIHQKVTKEFYVYNDKGFHSKSSMTPDPIAAGGGAMGLKIAKDSIVHVTSGLTDENNKMVVSHLHKAIKPLNQLQVLEDASVIYRISRAPERRIFYIDVGNLPKMKAEQYLRDMMTKHKNRLVYDAASGEIRDDRKFMTMMEDFWLPRREGGRGTEITTLPGGQNLGEMEDIEYFKKKLFRSLNVPVSRLEPEAGFTLGRASEISRDELKFNKFIRRLRLRFSQLFDSCLEKQLVFKGICTIDEWHEMAQSIKYDYVEDNHFAELKNSEVVRERLQTLNDIENSVGVYYSKEWIKRNVLKQNEQEIKDMQAEMDAEREDSDDFGPGGGSRPDAPWNALATRPGYIAQPGDENPQPEQEQLNSELKKPSRKG
tara:strand:- start:3862 stop:5517 length:1656 start_codon:yes stop_codon:yes gene_type:complete